MKYTLQLALLVLIAFSNAIKAQRQPILTLKDAFAYADRTYPGLAERTAGVEEFEIRKKEVQSKSLPQVQLQAQQSYGTFQGSSGAFFPVPGVFNVTGNSPGLDARAHATGNAFGSVLVDWKVFEFGRQRKSVDAAEYQVQGARSSYDASRLSLHSKISQLYVEIFYSRANLQWAERNVARMNQVLEIAKSLSSAGLKPGADTAIVSSAYSQAQAVRYEWLGRYQASKANFTEVVPNLNWSVVELSSSEMEIAETNQHTINPAHPYLQVIEKQLAYEKAREQVVARKVLPSFSILGGVSTRGSGIGQNGNIDPGISSGYQNLANNYLVGAGITWNIGNAYTSSLERKRSQKTITGVQEKYNLQQLQMNSALSAVAVKILQQRALINQTQKACEKASEAYDLYLARYQGGLINLTELLQIQALLQSSQRDNLQAGQNYWDLITAQAELSSDFSLLLSHFN